MYSDFPPPSAAESQMVVSDIKEKEGPSAGFRVVLANAERGLETTSPGCLDVDTDTELFST